MYLIYISDVKTDLDSNDLDSDIDVLNDLEETIENMIMERNNDTVYVANVFNTVFEEVFKSLQYEYISIVDIFSEIAESLGIYLYEDEEYVVGNEMK